MRERLWETGVKRWTLEDLKKKKALNPMEILMVWQLRSFGLASVFAKRLRRDAKLPEAAFPETAGPCE